MRAMSSSLRAANDGSQEPFWGRLISLYTFCGPSGVVWSSLESSLSTLA